MQPDPLFEKLRQLPALVPDPQLTDRVARAALLALAKDSPATRQESAAPAPMLPGWRTYLQWALYRAALPTALAGATALYLSWAVSAASHLY